MRNMIQIVCYSNSSRTVAFRTHYGHTYQVSYNRKSLLLYRMSQKEMSIFWEVTVSVILRKKVYTYMCPIPSGFRDRGISLNRSLNLAPNIVHHSRLYCTPLDFCLWGWMKSEAYRTKVDTRDELLDLIMDVIVSI